MEENLGLNNKNDEFLRIENFVCYVPLIKKARKQRAFSML